MKIHKVPKHIAIMHNEKEVQLPKWQTTIMSFGKHKGKQLKDVCADVVYCNLLKNNVKLDHSKHSDLKYMLDNCLPQDPIPTNVEIVLLKIPHKNDDNLIKMLFDAQTQIANDALLDKISKQLITNHRMYVNIVGLNTFGQADLSFLLETHYCFAILSELKCPNLAEHFLKYYDIIATFASHCGNGVILANKLINAQSLQTVVGAGFACCHISSLIGSIIICGVHLAPSKSSDVRAKQCRKIHKLITNFNNEKCPVFIIGDTNMRCNETTILTKKYNDAYMEYSVRYPDDNKNFITWPNTSMHGFENAKYHFRFDRCYSKKSDLLSFEVKKHNDSDHFSIHCEYSYKIF